MGQVNAQWSRPGLKVAVLATPGTVSSERYLQFLDPQFEVFQVPCPGLASAIESGLCQGPALAVILDPFLEPLKAWQPDVIILGCTHYSFIVPAVQAAFGPAVQIADSAEILARTAVPVIQKLQLSHQEQTITVTGDAQQFRQAMNQLPLAVLAQKPIKTVCIEQENLLQAK
jgi:glutamate racemase